MRKYFYFRAVADEVDDDDQISSIAIPAESIRGMVPVGIDTIDIYLNTKTITTANTLRLAVTRGKLQEVMKELVAYINGYSHTKSPMVVMGDLATTTVNANSIEGNDKTKDKIFFSSDVTSVAIV